jgi:hypothetical protein
MNDEEYYQERKGYVMVDGEEIPVDDTIFVNISEDFDGKDLYTFKYKGKTYSRNVFVK